MRFRGRLGALAAAALGRTAAGRRVADAAAIYGERDGLGWVVEAHRRILDWSTVITVQAPSAPPSALSIASRTAASTWGPAPAVLTLDAEFDAEFQVRGPRDEAAARLDSGTRAAFRALAARGTIQAGGGALELELRGHPAALSTLGDVRDQVLEVAGGWLSPGDPIPARLLRNARAEASLAVRHQNLELLLTVHARAPEAAEGLRLAAAAPERGLRYLAILGEGRDPLPLLEEITAAADEPAALRAVALRQIARHAPAERAIVAVRGALAAPPGEGLVGVAAELAGRLGARGCVERLLTLAETPELRDPERARVLEALGLLGERAHEETLLRHLEDPSPEVRCACASALGRVGTAAALKHLARLRRWAFPDEVAAAAEMAIARVEARLLVAEPGWVSFPAEQAGALSLEREKDPRPSGDQDASTRS